MVRDPGRQLRTRSVEAPEWTLVPPDLYFTVSNRLLDGIRKSVCSHAAMLEAAAAIRWPAFARRVWFDCPVGRRGNACETSYCPLAPSSTSTRTAAATDRCSVFLTGILVAATL